MFLSVACCGAAWVGSILTRRASQTPGGADSSDEVYFYASRGLGGKCFWRSMAWDMVRFRRCLCLEIVAS